MSNININDYKECSIIKLQGRMDAKNSLMLKEEFKKLISHNKSKFIVDLSDVDFIDSAFLGAIVYVNRMIAGKNGFIRFIKGNDRVMHVIKQTRFNIIFEFFTSMKEITQNL